MTFIREIFLITSFVVSIQYCSGQIERKSPIDTSLQAVILFDYKVLDLGEIKVGSKTTCKYKFKNIGRLPLIIKDVKTTCGCTLAKFTSVPILYKKKGEVLIEFTAPLHTVNVNKSLIVVTNTYEKSIL